MASETSLQGQTHFTSYFIYNDSCQLVFFSTRYLKAELAKHKL